MIGWMVRRIVGSTHEWLDGWLDGLLDQHMNGWMDG